MAKISFGKPFNRVRSKKISSKRISKVTKIHERVVYIYNQNDFDCKDYMVGAIVKERNGYKGLMGLRICNIKEEWIGWAASWQEAKQYVKDNIDKLL